MKITNQAISKFASPNKVRQNENPYNIIFNKFERTPQKDSVVFTGKNSVHKPHEKPLPQNVQAGVKFAEDIHNLSKSGDINLDSVAEIVHSHDGDVDVRSIEEMASFEPNWQNYAAFFYGTMNDSFESENKEMFLKMPNQQDSKDVLGFIMNSSHEFTHAQQTKNNPSFEFLKRVSKEDIMVAKAIMGLGEELFKYFDMEYQALASLQTFNNPEDISSFKNYKIALPRKADVSKGNILRSLNVENEKEFKSQVLEKFNQDFDFIMTHIDTDSDFYKYVPYKNNLNKLASLAKTYCAYKAHEEYEAYTTENVVGKKMCNIKGSANIDVLPLYYQMLEKAFS